MNLDDTIVAIATPPGRGGIGVVRLAGPEARAIAQPMLRLSRDLEPGRAIFGEFIEPSLAVREQRPGQPRSGARMQPTAGPELAEGAQAVGTEVRSDQAPEGRKNSADVIIPSRIDEVVVTYFAKPHSYTTDDIVEISAHGSPVVLRHIVELSLAQGARLADPGEFTMRAFLNGRLDLTQAEAVRDLIDAQTLFQAKVAAQQLEGALSNRLKPIKKRLIDLIALLEAGIDFAEDDISVAPDATILAHIAEVTTPLQQLAASFTYGKLVHRGLTLAIVGRPNVGKSSLFNCLVERERAIVTAQPGTTRDLVSETVSIGGIPVELVDTAGLRKAQNEAETIGIKKSMEALADADLVLVVLDDSQPLSEEDRQLLAQTSDRPAIVVANKSDLATNPNRQPSVMLSGTDASQGEASAESKHPYPLYGREPRTANGEKRAPNVEPRTRSDALSTSALTGQGIPALRAAILHHVAGDATTQQESGFLTSIRHQRLVTDALAALAAATTAVSAHVPHEMLLLDLYAALRPLDEVTGATTTDDILNLIFGTFCIGK